ncbi:MAG TPA: hypothetical protein VHX15_17060 [Frankiaceae bacterium]|nr:hypothetical protein [Frankiaceae bacterium]
MDLESLENVANELYGLAPKEFVAARTEAEKRARAAGDRELAGQIHALAKPTAAAWAANQLVRQHPDEIAGLGELGAGLREATATLEREQLKSLSQQQNRVIAALVSQGRALAKAAGQAMSEPTERGLEATLRAALADEELAAQLSAGQLSSALEHVGFAGTLTGSATGSAPKPARKAPAKAPQRDELKERRRRAQVERAQADLREARTAQRQAASALEHAESGLERAEAAVAEAKAAMRRAENDHTKAKQAADKAQTAAEQAGQRVDDAEAHLAEASGPDG